MEIRVFFGKGKTEITSCMHLASVQAAMSPRSTTIILSTKTNSPISSDFTGHEVPSSTNSSLLLLLLLPCMSSSESSDFVSWKISKTKNSNLSSEWWDLKISSNRVVLHANEFNVVLEVSEIYLGWSLSLLRNERKKERMANDATKNCWIFYNVTLDQDDLRFELNVSESSVLENKYMWNWRLLN